MSCRRWFASLDPAFNRAVEASPAVVLAHSFVLVTAIIALTVLLFRDRKSEAEFEPDAVVASPVRAKIPGLLSSAYELFLALRYFRSRRKSAARVTSVVAILNCRGSFNADCGSRLATVFGMRCAKRSCAVPLHKCHARDSRPINDYKAFGTDQESSRGYQCRSHKLRRAMLVGSRGAAYAVRAVWIRTRRSNQRRQRLHRRRLRTAIADGKSKPEDLRAWSLVLTGNSNRASRR